MPRGARLVAVLVLCAGLGDSQAVRASGESLTGKQLFVRHCARCHTTAGSGLPAGHPLLANFRSPPADFTDPLFNSMEPAGDWLLAVKHGGASMGLSPQMPAHAGRMSGAELEAVVAHLAGFAETAGYPPGELNFTRAIRTIKAFPESELLFLERYEAARDDGPAARRSTLYYARRLGRRLQAEAKLSHLDRGSASELQRGHVALNFGVELPLAGARDVYRYRLHAFLLWDMADGGFWLGW